MDQDHDDHDVKDDDDDDKFDDDNDKNTCQRKQTFRVHAGPGVPAWSSVMPREST